MRRLQVPLSSTLPLNHGCFNTGSILVREIWIGNLPPTITEKQVRQTSELFGEVENVDLHNKVLFLLAIFKTTNPFPLLKMVIFSEKKLVRNRKNNQKCKNNIFFSPIIKTTILLRQILLLIHC